MYDIAIIGAGVVGSLVARSLSQFNLNMIILDKENDVACGATKANSALIHAGYDAPFDSLRGKLNARGNELYSRLSSELNFSFERIGSLVLGEGAEDLKTLERLLANGRKLNIPGLRIIDHEEIMALESNICDHFTHALYAPTAGITEPWEVAIAACENAMDNGVELRLNYEVNDIIKREAHYIINGEIESKLIINCAGVYADFIYSLVLPNQNTVKINARRGQYYLLDKEAGELVNHILFTCPTEKGKGTIISPTAHGNIIVGPNSEHVAKEDTTTTFDGLFEVLDKAKQIVPELPVYLNIANFAGVRAEPVTGDFIIEESEVKGFINVAGIKSPGLSSAPAIAERVTEIIVNIFSRESIPLEVNVHYSPLRRARHHFVALDKDAQKALIESDARFAHIICRCETISEAEIVDAIHRNCGATTLNGIKRRVRPGAGRCQGGFCGPKIVDILARELNIKRTEVELERSGSYPILGGDQLEKL
ncbi:FAD-dependent oxidoreductase [Fusibacter bizertensis]